MSTSPYQERSYDPIVVKVPPTLSRYITYDSINQVIKWKGDNIDSKPDLAV